MGTGPAQGAAHRAAHGGAHDHAQPEEETGMSQDRPSIPLRKTNLKSGFAAAGITGIVVALVLAAMASPGFMGAVLILCVAMGLGIGLGILVGDLVTR